MHVGTAHHLHVQVLRGNSLIVKPPQVPVLHPGLKPRNVNNTNFLFKYGEFKETYIS